MSITKVQVAALVDELKGYLSGGTLRSLQAVDKRSFVLHISVHSLLICLQEPFLRFHLLTQSGKEHESSFSKALFSHLNGAKVSSITQLNEDRILALDLRSGNRDYRLVAELFPKRPNLYLLDGDQILHSLNPVSETRYSLPSAPVLSHPGDSPLTSHQLEILYNVKENEAKLFQEKQQLLQRLKQRIKRLKKTHSHCEEELDKGLAWKQRQHEAELLQAHFYLLKRGMQEVTLTDWEQNVPLTLALDSTLEPKVAVARRFKLAKKLRLSIEPLQRQLQSIQNQLEPLEKELELVSAATNWEELAAFKQSVHLPQSRTTEEKEALRALPYREFVTESGLKIWVGKDARSNEKLTFSLARGSDFWLHVHNYPGAHVVLRVGKAEEPDREALQDAIQVALAYSGAKEQGEAEICVTQCKFVSRLGRKTGQVQISKHKILRARFDAERFKRIKERS